MLGRRAIQSEGHHDDHVWLSTLGHLLPADPGMGHLCAKPVHTQKSLDSHFGQ